MSNEKERQNKREKGVLLPEGVVVDGNNMEPPRNPVESGLCRCGTQRTRS
jgi:hypothetical protein